MKLALIEKQNLGLRIAPDLGVAYLSSSCRDKGIDVRIVPGSPDSLKAQLFGSDELLESNRYSSEDFRRAYEVSTSNAVEEKMDPELIAWVQDILDYSKNVFLSSDSEHGFREYMKNKIKDTNADAVAFSFWDMFAEPEMYVRIREVMADLRAELDVPMIVGGPSMGSKKARQFLLENFDVDYILYHEGEQSLPDLLYSIETGSDPSNIPGVSFKHGGTIVDNNPLPVSKLDEIPDPDFSQFDLDSYFLPVRLLPIMSSRGCPWGHCAFCSHHESYGGYFEYSVERFSEMLESLSKTYKTDLFMFHDETLESGRAVEISRAVIEKNLKVYLYSYARLNGFTKPVFDLMYKAGFRVLVWGLESGSQRVLNLMRKGINLSDARRILKESHESGMTNVCFTFFGFPGETREEALETVEFLNENSRYIDDHGSGVFMLMEGSPIYDNPALWGIEIVGDYDYKVIDKSAMSQNDVRDFLKYLAENEEIRKKRTTSGRFIRLPGSSELRGHLLFQTVRMELERRKSFRSTETKDIVQDIVQG